MNDLRETGSFVLAAATHWHIFKIILIVDKQEKNEDGAEDTSNSY
jgi:hypothetical protein